MSIGLPTRLLGADALSLSLLVSGTIDGDSRNGPALRSYSALHSRSAKSPAIRKVIPAGISGMDASGILYASDNR
jgi:hypothetical protein